MIRLSNIRLDVESPLSHLDDLVKKSLQISGATPPYTILKESLDARKRDRPTFVYQVLVDLPWSEKEVRRLRNRDAHWVAPNKEFQQEIGDQPLCHPPVIIGAGPAGLFTAYTLAQYGYKPLLLEQGEEVEARTETVEHFWRTGELNPQSNVQFGEGGAGAFSDGKLTSRSKNPLNDKVREIFVTHGAPERVRYAVKAHLGTDLLKGVLRNMRRQIIAWGGRVEFGVQVYNLVQANGRVKGVESSIGFIPGEHVILATGHSARDFFRALYSDGLAMESKPFAVGFRIEHHQSMIDQVQYHGIAPTPRMGAASYQLTWKDTLSGRGIYTFCMCPGGLVINASSEAGRLAVNGMSYHARNGENANSAVLVTIGEKDYGSGVLDGLRFQEHIEEKAFDLGGGGYAVPVQQLADFMAGRSGTAPGSIHPSVTPAYHWTNLSHLYSAPLTDALRRGIAALDRKLPGFARGDAVLTGVETRSSSPIRILRSKEGFESLSIKGFYPIGEGAGYAGGIASSAIDGLSFAQQWMAQFLPFQ